MSPASAGGSVPEVLVMAGGEGRRLGALTSTTPKPMLPVAGRPVLQHLLEQLREQGVEHVFLSVRHLSHVISDYFGDGRWLGLDIEYVVERRALGTAGAIGLIAEHRKPLLVVNGDVVTPVPLTALTAHHEQHGAAMTIGCVEQTLPVAYGVIDHDGPDVVRLREKPELVVPVVAGVYLLAPGVASGVGCGMPLAMPDLIEAVMGVGRVVAFPLPGPWLDIGTPDCYARADEVAGHTAVALPSQIVAEARVGNGYGSR